MKKVFALVLVLTLLAGGAYAQKKNTKVPPSAATKTTKDLSVQSVKMLDSRRLPPPGVGMEASRSIVRSWEDVVDEVLDRYNALISRKKLIRPIH